MASLHSSSLAPYVPAMSCALGQNNAAAERQGIPARSLNGGLYTGEPFKANAPWANVPVVPDAAYMIHYNLRSANPPPEALLHYPGTVRPGNNEPVYDGITRLGGVNQNCAAPDITTAPRSCPCYKCSMSKYAYL